MGCGACVHGYGMDYSGNVRFDAVQTIECTLNPIWQQVSSDHFCSQFWNDWDAPKNRERTSAFVRGIKDERERYRVRAVDAERKLKAANKRLREMRAKGGGA